MMPRLFSPFPRLWALLALTTLPFAGTLEAQQSRVPVGVVGAITAYNYPFFLNLAKIGPGLAAGNTIVLKPSPFTPFSALIIAEAARAVDADRWRESAWAAHCLTAQP